MVCDHHKFFYLIGCLNNICLKLSRKVVLQYTNLMGYINILKSEYTRSSRVQIKLNTIYDGGAPSALQSANWRWTNPSCPVQLATGREGSIILWGELACPGARTSNGMLPANTPN